MSWKEDLENIKFTIKTGDGKIFTPLWKNAVKLKEYNVSSYSFINVDGEFVDRKKPQSGKYPLIFWFQGEDNIQQTNEFENSADDSRPWEIKHPFYGTLKGQPISIKRDDSNYNVTQITVDFWESINDDYPNPKRSINDAIVTKTFDVVKISAASYNSRINPTSVDQQILGDSVIQITSVFDKLFDNDNFSKYQTLRNKALVDVGNLVDSPINAIDSTHKLLTTPSLFIKPVINRINSIIVAFEKLKSMLIESETVNTKLYFESETAVLIASLCQCTATPLENDYVTRTEIEDITAIITKTYNEYLQILDDSQIDINNVLNAYHPDSVTQLELYELVTETTGQLFSLAFEAKQERMIELNKNTNLILLTHKYLGLDVNDENIEEFRQLNNIKSDELFSIKKGRTIKYFV